MTHWLTSTNHKSIGIMYMMTSVSVFHHRGNPLAGHPPATRAARSKHRFSAHAYNQIFTLHGTAMIFLVIAPFAFGLGNYLVPLQIGAPDMAYPRLNAFGVYLFMISGFTIFAGVFAQGGGAMAGWTAYAPLSTMIVGSGGGQDLWCIGIMLNAIATIMVAINFTATIFLYRAPGMTMWRMPIFTWEILATALLILMAFPSLSVVDGRAAARAALRRAFLRSAVRRQRRPLPAFLLVFRPSGSLRDDFAVLWRHFRNRCRSSRRSRSTVTSAWCSRRSRSRVFRWACGRTTCSRPGSSRTASFPACRFSSRSRPA